MLGMLITERNQLTLSGREKNARQGWFVLFKPEVLTRRLTFQEILFSELTFAHLFGKTDILTSISSVNICYPSPTSTYFFVFLCVEKRLVILLGSRV